MMETHYCWWILGASMVVLELLTGTLYLLVLALGCFGGAIATMLGLGISAQLLVTAAITMAGWGLLRNRQMAKSALLPSSGRDSAVNLDIGESLNVDRWEPTGATYATYRGAKWQVEHEVPSTASQTVSTEPINRQPGSFKIVEITGNRLIVAPIKVTSTHS